MAEDKVLKYEFYLSYKEWNHLIENCLILLKQAMNQHLNSNQYRERIFLSQKVTENKILSLSGQTYDLFKYKLTENKKLLFTLSSEGIEAILNMHGPITRWIYKELDSRPIKV